MSRFEEFTTQAQRFMQFLQSTIELHGLSEEDFIDYKERLIDYLQRFVNELITSASEIEQKTAALEQNGIREVFTGVTRQSRADALDPDDPEKLAAETDRLEGRWEGLRRWFVGGPDGQSQAETLRARTREAIPSLLGALANFHDRRESGSDRQRDWRELAHWFADAEDDAEAHRLWRVAFAMGPARHLRINEETLAFREQSNESPRTSWLDAEPMWLEPRLRKTGRSTRSGRAPDIVEATVLANRLRDGITEPVSVSDLEAKTKRFTQENPSWRKDTRVDGAEVVINSRDHRSPPCAVSRRTREKRIR